MKQIRRIGLALSAALILLNIPLQGQTNLAGRVTLAWDEWSPEVAPLIGGVRIHYGFASQNYTNVQSFPPCCTGTIEGLPLNVPIFFAATAYHATNSAIESEFSNEVSFMITNLPGTNVLALLNPAQFRLTGVEIYELPPITNEPPPPPPTNEPPCEIVTQSNRGSETYSTPWPTGAAYIATPFVPGSHVTMNRLVCEARIPLSFSGNLNGELYASIWTGQSQPTTQTGAESTAVPLTLVPTGTNDVMFVFPEPAIIAPATTNWVVLRGNGLWGAINNLGWRRNSNLGSAGGVFYSSNGTNWTASTLYRRSCFTLLRR